MRVLKTMNTTGVIKKDSYAPSSTIAEGTQHQRRGAKTLEKVSSIIRFVVAKRVSMKRNAMKNNVGQL